MDLQQWNFNNNGNIELNGKWEFYWNKLLTPNNFINTQKEPHYAEFKKLWNSLNVVFPEVNAFGSATYRLNIKIDSTKNRTLALGIPPLYTSYKIWIDGNEVGKSGTTALSKKNYIPFWERKTIPFTSNGNNIEIIIQISNYDHSKGGPGYSLLLGNFSEIQRYKDQLITFDMFLIGALIMGGIYFLGLFKFGSNSNSVLYFALFSFIFSYRIISTEPYVISEIFPNIPWYIFLRLEYISLYLSTYIFFKFIEELFPNEINYLFLSIYKITPLLTTAFTIFAPAFYFTQLIGSYLIFIISGTLYLIYITLKAVKNKRIGAVYTLYSFITIGVISIINMFDYWGYYSSPKFIYIIGYILFFFFQSLILSYRFTAQYKESTKQAELATLAKSDFLSTMSHEIRTPMNGVIGMTYLLQKTNLNKIQKEYVDIINVSGENLLTVINDILDFSKIEQGKMELENMSFDLRKIIDDTLTVLRISAEKKEIELILDMDYNVPRYIISDSVRIKQILINLINNALKFTSKGSITTKVILNSIIDNKHEIKFEIIDTGIGIPENKLNRLFKTFSQVDSSTTRQYGGTGLGLAISKKLSELLGGEIGVRSTPNIGSTFYFTIKVNSDSEKSILQKTKDQEKFKGKKTIILDDNHVNLIILSSQLKEFGIEVTSESNHYNFIEKVKNNNYDLAILDMKLNNTTGVEVAKEVKTITKAVKMPMFLFSSVKTDNTDVINTLFKSYSTKPVREEKLISELHKIFNNNESKLELSTINTKQKSVNNEINYINNDVNILVAEDNIINQKVAAGVIKNLGYKTDIANDGLEAVEACKVKDYDIVFMDLQMPNMGGIDACKKIFENCIINSKPNPTIIAMSANVFQESRQMCENVGMKGFVNKPIVANELNKCIKRWSVELIQHQV
ncbi:MAG: response regulator [Ichthyobacteriaceae bacterium]|nr:response regulator [Ichthyobacteriaceae bacterium]